MSDDVKSDIEIARAATKQPIWDIAAKLGLATESLEPYGNDKAKLSTEAINGLADRPDGKLILRFPNAQSPFGLQPQMGDPTHRSALSRSVIELLITDLALTVSRYGPSYRFRGTSLGKKAIRSIRFLLQTLITRCINLIYATNIPYNPVVIIVVRKTEE